MVKAARTMIPANERRATAIPIIVSVSPEYAGCRIRARALRVVASEGCDGPSSYEHACSHHSDPEIECQLRQDDCAGDCKRVCYDH